MKRLEDGEDLNDALCPGACSILVWVNYCKSGLIWINDIHM